MVDNNRQDTRIQKNINIQYCVAGALFKKWDVSVIEDISAGGVKFIAPVDFGLNDKILQLQIRIPELAPLVLELEAMVVNVKPNARPGFNTKYSEVRAKFINLSKDNKEHLAVVKEMIDLKKIRSTFKK
jgi:hypothetical protein